MALVPDDASVSAMDGSIVGQEEVASVGFAVVGSGTISVSFMDGSRVGEAEVDCVGLSVVGILAGDSVTYSCIVGTVVGSSVELLE